MISFILPYILKSKNYLTAGFIILFISMFIIFYFKTKKEIINLNNEIKEYKRIEEEVKNQNFNVKQNVQIIKKRTNNLNIDDRKQLLEKMFSE
jgi:hypothetical protein